MRTLSFFRCSLLAPIFLPVATFATGSTSGVAFVLLMSLAFGGIPYLVMAVFLWARLGRLQGVRDYFRLALLAPLMFVPLQFTAWLLWSSVGDTTPKTYSNLLAPLLPLGAYGLLFGYAYVLLVGVVYALLHRLGVVTESNVTAKDGGNTNAA